MYSHTHTHICNHVCCYSTNRVRRRPQGHQGPSTCASFVSLRPPQPAAFENAVSLFFVLVETPLEIRTVLDAYHFFEIRKKIIARVSRLRRREIQRPSIELVKNENAKHRALVLCALVDERTPEGEGARSIIRKAPDERALDSKKKKFVFRIFLRFSSFLFQNERMNFF